MANRFQQSKSIAVTAAEPCAAGAVGSLAPSRLFMGGEFLGLVYGIEMLLDECFEQGVTAFDTAHIYGLPPANRTNDVLGRWMQSRGVSAQCTVALKVAHRPDCAPMSVGPQVQEALARLQRDRVDVLMVHQDDASVPVGEWIDALATEHAAGRARAIGLSNWTPERFDAAALWALAKNRPAPTVISNQFSLARMIEPPCPGNVSLGDEAGMAWLKDRRPTLLAWSALSGGFAAKADPLSIADARTVRCWYDKENFSRMQRLKVLAQARGVTPVQAALAYVLSQPMPTFAVVGPRTMGELRGLVAATHLALTPEELATLEGGRA
jgi:aryl-alcohol dehydrogenase-like predicted oxidoreductase